MGHGICGPPAARKLAVRLYWMLRTNTPYPEIVSIENSPRGAPGQRKLGP